MGWLKLSKEYVIAPKRVLRYGSRGFITIPRELLDKLGGKLVEVRITVIDEDLPKKD
ncbi:MAG: hypothetical protein QW328_09705 [Nitrososphaerota archaeon]